MKRHLLYIITAVMLFLAVVTSCKKEKDEENVMKMTTSASGDVTISLAGTGSATIDWGDGSESDTKTISPPTGIDIAFTEFIHSYSGTNTRTIIISGKKITGMICRYFPLTALDVSENNVLKQLELSYNQLTNINVSNNTALTCLHCSLNPLTSLNVSKNTALTDLICYGTPLESLDVSNNTMLNLLWCFDNQLTSLDVSKNTMLVWLDCSGNQLAVDALDVLFGTLHSNTITFPIPVPVIKEITIYNNPGTDDCNQSIATEKGWTVKTNYPIPTSITHQSKMNKPNSKTINYKTPQPWNKYL